MSEQVSGIQGSGACGHDMLKVCVALSGTRGSRRAVNANSDCEHACLTCLCCIKLMPPSRGCKVPCSLILPASLRLKFRLRCGDYRTLGTHMPTLAWLRAMQK